MNRLNFHEKFTILICISVFIFSIYTLFSKVILLKIDPDMVDFKYFWIAGKSYRLNLDPYSPQFKSIGQSFVRERVDAWLYPPQWWIICVTLAKFSANAALSLWRIVCGISLYICAGLLGLAIAKMKPAIPAIVVLPILSLPMYMEGTLQCLAVGQSSVLIFCSACLITRAILIDSSFEMIAGITLLCFKPQLALPIIIYLLFLKKWHKSLFAAAIISLLLSLPQIFLFGLTKTISEFLTNVAIHDKMVANFPTWEVGFTNLAYRAFGIIFSGSECVLIAAALALLIMYIWKAHFFEKDIDLIVFAFLLSVIFFVIPLHPYDSEIEFIPVVLLLTYNSKNRLLIIFGSILVARSGFIGGWFGDRQLMDRYFQSIAELIILVGSSAILYSEIHRTRRTAPPNAHLSMMGKIEHGFCQESREDK